LAKGVSLGRLDRDARSETSFRLNLREIIASTQWPGEAEAAEDRKRSPSIRASASRMKWKQSVLCEVHVRHVPHRVHVPFEDRFDGTVSFFPLNDSQFLQRFFWGTPSSGRPGCHHHTRRRGAVRGGTSERVTLGTSKGPVTMPPRGCHWGHGWAARRAPLSNFKIPENCRNINPPQSPRTRCMPLSR